LTKQQGVIWDQERIIQEEKEARLRMELEHKNRELVTRAMILTQENEDKIKLIKELKTIQEKLSATGNENALLVEEQIRNLRTNISSASWEDFRMYFENVYSGFYQNLEKAYPDLTPNEKKLCALLKLNLTTKEIATITSREVRSIESSRIRLRKKLQLTMETNLVTFLSQF
jgi:DNA-binding CsgD family transcriptional regulator